MRRAINWFGALWFCDLRSLFFPILEAYHVLYYFYAAATQRNASVGDGNAWAGALFAQLRFS
ncbi:MAG: hypothetical protein CTY16_06230 [Methylobacter sp.]|nr:MAG: hypothetical protein CTY16_06230 [Methylobacter sp.]